MTLYDPVDVSQLKTFSINERKHKVDLASFAGTADRGSSFAEWLGTLPKYLAVNSLNKAVDAIVSAHQAQRPVVFALGAHVVKVGCAPVINDLIARGVVKALSFNGATAIHDVEVATLGSTSEEVADTIRDGSFGMVEETPALFAEASRLATAERTGLGAALGKVLDSIGVQHPEHSLLIAAHRAQIPVTVHVALGTDTIHMHENANGAMIGQSSMVDFKIICSVVADMAPDSAQQASGVWCNIGSAVLLPEIFLKAISVARNLGSNLDGITTVNMDMIRHYRPTQNVISRPVSTGNGLELIGHHEIMLPLLRQAIIERL